MIAWAQSFIELYTRGGVLMGMDRQFDGLVQDYSIPNALAMEISQSFSEQSIFKRLDDGSVAIMRGRAISFLTPSKL